MTARSEDLTVVERTVIVFDICSSSNILEDLMLSGSLKPMRNLIISVKRFLQTQSETSGVEVYKFIGDGWILLFPPNVSGQLIIGFLQTLSSFFKKKLKKHVLPHLQTVSPVLGLTFGVDKGNLIRMIMIGKEEYIGRPLNIASRLQSAIKEKDDNPAYKILFSKPSFVALGLDSTLKHFTTVKRTLRNIQGGKNYACVKVRLTL